MGYIGPIVTTLTVATAGTRVQCSATALPVLSVYFEALGTNTGSVFIGDSTVSSSKYMSARSAGLGINVSWDNAGSSARPGSTELDLSKFYIDASANTQIIQMTYLTRLGTKGPS